MTQLGLVRYLVKYVSKVEPTFTTRVKESVSEVEKYFTTRLIGAPEVATTLLSFQIEKGGLFGHQSSRPVKQSAQAHGAYKTSGG